MDLLIADELEFASVQMSPPAFAPGVSMRPFSMMSLVLTLVALTPSGAAGSGVGKGELDGDDLEG